MVVKVLPVLPSARQSVAGRDQVQSSAARRALLVTVARAL